MSQLSQLRNNFDNFVNDLPNVIERSINFNEDLELLNRQQLRASKLADGSDVNEEYESGYFLFKQANFPQSFGDGKVNFFLRGTLQDGIEITATGGKFSLFTPVSYAKKLEEQYGNYLGIAPYNYPRAKRITTVLIRNEFKRRVLKR